MPEQHEPTTRTETGAQLELYAEPKFIPLGYSLGSAELDDGRTLQLVGTGPAVYFRIEGNRALVKLNLSPLAAVAANLLGGASE